MERAEILLRYGVRLSAYVTCAMEEDSRERGLVCSPRPTSPPSGGLVSFSAGLSHPTVVSHFLLWLTRCPPPPFCLFLSEHILAVLLAVRLQLTPPPFLLPSCSCCILFRLACASHDPSQEYLRRIIEACLVSAREGGAGGARQLGAKAPGGVVPTSIGLKGAAALPQRVLSTAKRDIGFTRAV